jgi:hypothetical protein
MADEDASGSPGQNAARPGGRYGQHTARSGASFRCGVCGEVAAMVKLLRSGEVADMGPPPGPQLQAADGVIIDYWLGSTCWMAVNAERWARIEAVLSAEHPDPGAPCMPSTGNSRRSGAPNARPATAVTTGAAPSSSTAPSTTTRTANAQLATAT